MVAVSAIAIAVIAVGNGSGGWAMVKYIVSEATVLSAMSFAYRVRLCEPKDKLVKVVFPIIATLICPSIL